MAFGSLAGADERMEGIDEPESAPEAVSVPAFRPTEEQEAIRDAVLSGKDVAVKAFAGTGKTSTLVFTANTILEQKPGQKITYFAYNRSMADEAKTRFPYNTVVSTAHGLAARSTINGKRVSDLYLKRLVMGGGIKKLRDRIAEDLSPEVDKVRSFFPQEYTAISAIMQTLQRFTQSDDRQVYPKHASRDHAIYLKDMFDRKTAEAFGDAVAEATQALWDKMQTDRSFPVLHDVYLKAWEMDGNFHNHGLVFFDEAQDANPVMLSVLKKMRQAGSQIVLVGDPHQAIYGWRGATDAMKAFPDIDPLYLTESWRFGENIAQHAQLFLDAAEETKPLRGRNPNPGEFYDYSGLLDGGERPFEPNAILCRSNGGVIVEAIKAIESGKRPYIVGNSGTNGAEESAKLMLSMGALYDGDRRGPKHPEIALFDSWDKLTEFAETKDGQQFSPFIKMTTELKQHGTFDRVVDLLRRETAKHANEGDLVVCTMHKSKGLEWGKVRLGSDAEKVNMVNAHAYNNKQDVAFTLSQENYKLLYVAFTRGKEAFDASGRYAVYQNQLKVLRENPVTPEIKEIIQREQQEKIDQQRALRDEFSNDE